MTSSLRRRTGPRRPVRGGAGGVAADPLESLNAKMTARYRADQATDVGGGLISLWPNIAPNTGTENDLIQNTGTAQPLRVATPGVINGEPYLVFDATTITKLMISPGGGAGTFAQAGDDLEIWMITRKFDSGTNNQWSRATDQLGGAFVVAWRAGSDGNIQAAQFSPGATTSFQVQNTAGDFNWNRSIYRGSTYPSAADDTHTFIVDGATLGTSAHDVGSMRPVSKLDIRSVFTGNPGAEVWFAEIIIFNQALSVVEAAVVRSYLQNRYLLPVKNPLNILSDVAVWIRPDAGAVSKTGNEIDSIVNRGSLGGTANATLTDRPTHIVSDANFNGHPSIDYDATLQQRLLLPNLSGLGNFHIWHVTKTNVVPPVVGSGGIHVIGTSASSDHWPLNGTAVYMGAGSDTRRGPLTFSATLTNPNILEVLSTATEYTVKVNQGETLVTDGTNTPAGSAVAAMGGNLGGNILQEGQTVELIVCSTEQTPQAVLDLYVYLTERYGIISQVVIPPDGPDPSSITKTTAWYRADDVVLNAGRVETWPNRIPATGTANDLTQSVAGNRPVVSVAAINGQDAILFDDANDEHLDVVSGGLFTVGGSQFLNAIIIAATDDTGQNNQTYFRADNGGGGPGLIERLQQNNGNVQSNVVDPSNSTLNATNNDTNFHVIRVFLDGSDHQLYLDETQVGTTALVGAQSDVTELSVGAAANGMRPFSGMIADLFILNAPPTVDDLEKVQFYLDSRYGLLSPS